MLLSLLIPCTSHGCCVKVTGIATVGMALWWAVLRHGHCTAYHKGQKRVLQWALDRSAGSTFGCDVPQKGELHLYHNGRDVGLALKGFPQTSHCGGL